MVKPRTNQAVRFPDTKSFHQERDVTMETRWYDVLTLDAAGKQSYCLRLLETIVPDDKAEADK